MAEFARRIALHVAVSVAGRALGLAINAATFLYIARALGPERFGTYALALVFVTFFATVVDNGFNMTVSRMLTRTPARGALVLGNALVMKTVAALTLAMVATVVARAPWFDDRLRELVPVASGLILVTGLSVANAYFQARVDMRWVVAGDLLSRLTFFLLTLTVLSRGGGPLALLSAQVVSAVVGAAMPLSRAMRLLAPAFALDLTIWREILRPAVALSLSLALGIVTARFDVFALSRAVSDRELGLYSAAFRIIDLLLLVPGLILQVVFPAFVGEEAAPVALSSRYGRVASVLAVLGVPLAVFLTIAAEPILTLAAGDSYRGGSRGLAYLSWGMLAVFMASSMLYVLVALGRYRRLLVWSASGACVSILLAMALVPRYGSTGAATATVAAHVVVMLGLGFELACHGVTPWPALTPEAAGIGVVVGLVTILFLPHAPVAITAGIAGVAGGLLALGMPRTRREVSAMLRREPMMPEVSS